MENNQNTVYQISDWKNAVKIKNLLNPDIKIDILAMQESSGYILTVCEETSKSSNILYRIPVECSLNNTWSLSSLEAVGLLNTIGFPCEWVEKAEINSTAYKQLEKLKEFGWIKIIRIIRPAEVYVLDKNDKSNELSSIIPNFNYEDWEFLTVGIPASIEDILNNSKDLDKNAAEATES